MIRYDDFDIVLKPTKEDSQDEIDRRIERNCDGDCEDCVYTECVHSIL